MASEMAAEISEWSQLCKYPLKFDDPGVHTQALGGKEHNKTIKNDVGLLCNTKIQYGVKNGRRRVQVAAGL